MPYLLPPPFRLPPPTVMLRLASGSGIAGLLADDVAGEMAGGCVLRAVYLSAVLRGCRLELMFEIGALAEFSCPSACMYLNYCSYAIVNCNLHEADRRTPMPVPISIALPVVCCKAGKTRSYLHSNELSNKKRPPRGAIRLGCTQASIL